MINTLLITNTLEKSPSGGRELLCKLNHDALKDIYGERLVVFELPQRRLQGLTSAINAFRGHIDGLNSAVISKALRIVETENIGKIFVDGSNLGGFVRVIKKKFPQVEISTFFHNVEARFFWGSFRQNKTVHALAVAMANYLAERKSVKYSDKIICLSRRDSRLLQRIYGRSATHVSPMALQDKLPQHAVSPIHDAREKFALFVGGTFYANRAGITWFVKHVVPHISIKTCIVGRGFEDFRSELEINGKVKVVGEVESLAKWYLDSYFVIAPIFDGSGMKTKVAEALMFGKKIVGTPEAFSGYEEIVARAGRNCTSADDFVAAINTADGMVKDFFDTELRTIYELRFSIAAARVRLEDILGP
ncbi:MAG: glycosyltransferase family 4 protein [Spirochaetales bacterium]|jgi:glycosyltransferase involved in cell wall biosynthesis|nr:glycosyltransferase family 4 protein [Spirochaetales bacterium]